MAFVFPGDRELLTQCIGQKLEESTSVQADDLSQRKLKLGPGILRSGEQFNPIFAGSFRSVGSKFWLDYDQKRYLPVAGDRVIGVVVSVHSEQYKVDIGYHVYALLDVLAFEGASKRNRPQLTAGSVVYAKVVTANRDIEPEITCCSPDTGKADGLGELVDGYHLQVRSFLMKNILFSDKSSFLQALSQQKVSFDLVVGMNRVVWVRGKTLEQTHYLAYVMEALKDVLNENLFAVEMQRAKVVLG